MSLLVMMMNACFTAVGISMDAFAISVMNGIALRRISYVYAFVNSFLFGFFQGIMPLLGYILGEKFETAVSSFDHILTFALLSFISLRMISNGLKGDYGKENIALSYAEMFIQACVTSLDALVIGVGFISMKMNLSEAIISSTVIMTVTFFMCFIGVIGGKRFGKKLGMQAELAGGAILLTLAFITIISH